MKRHLVFVLLLLSAFYAISNEQMGGASSSGQMGDSWMTNSDSDPFPRHPRPRQLQHGEVKPWKSSPSMQRPEPEPDPFLGSPGSRRLPYKEPTFIDMPEQIRPQEPTQQMSQNWDQNNLNYHLNSCRWFYR